MNYSRFFLAKVSDLHLDSLIGQMYNVETVIFFTNQHYTIIGMNMLLKGIYAILFFIYTLYSFEFKIDFSIYSIYVSLIKMVYAQFSQK